MNEYRVIYFIVNDKGENAELSSLNEKEKEQWKMDMEARALSEYHNRKIKISIKSDFAD